MKGGVNLSDMKAFEGVLSEVFMEFGSKYASLQVSMVLVERSFSVTDDEVRKVLRRLGVRGNYLIVRSAVCIGLVGFDDSGGLFGGIDRKTGVCSSYAYKQDDKVEIRSDVKPVDIIAMEPQVFSSSMVKILQTVSDEKIVS